MDCYQNQRRTRLKWITTMIIAIRMQCNGYISDTSNCNQRTADDASFFLFIEVAAMIISVEVMISRVTVTMTAWLTRGFSCLLSYDSPSPQSSLTSSLSIQQTYSLSSLLITPTRSSNIFQLD